MEASIIITLNRPKSPNYLIPCSSDPLQPVPLIARFPLLSLSSASCLLYSVFFVPSCLSGYESIMQNKANFTMGNINISTARTKAYAKEQRTMNTKRYPKQTQSNPILLPATPFSAQKRTSPNRFLRRICARSYRGISHRSRSVLCTAGTAWSPPALPPHSRTHPYKAFGLTRLCPPSIIAAVLICIDNR